MRLKVIECCEGFVEGNGSEVFGVFLVGVVGGGWWG